LKNNPIIAHLALFSANLIYALNYGWAKDVMDDDYVKPFAFILLRVLGAGILFWITSVFYFEKVEKKDLFKMALCGLFGVAANQMMFFSGLNLTSTINASIIMVCSPIIVAILSSIIIKDKLTITKITGIALGLAGACILILNNVSSDVKGSYVGDILILLNASSYGLYLVLLVPLMKKYSPITVIKWVFTFGLIYVIPFSLSQVNEISMQMPSDIIMKIGFVILFTTFFAYLLNIYGVSKLSPTIVSTYIYLQPLLTSIIAIITGREKITYIIVIACLLIFLGVYLVSKRLVYK
jgi:drug/metabolite transporter (DMT)-like permease